MVIYKTNNATYVLKANGPIPTYERNADGRFIKYGSMRHDQTKLTSAHYLQEVESIPVMFISLSNNNRWAAYRYEYINPLTDGDDIIDILHSELRVLVAENQRLARDIDHATDFINAYRAECIVRNYRNRSPALGISYEVEHSTVTVNLDWWMDGEDALVSILTNDSTATEDSQCSAGSDQGVTGKYNSEILTLNTELGELRKHVVYKKLRIRGHITPELIAKINFTQFPELAELDICVSSANRHAYDPIRYPVYIFRGLSMLALKHLRMPSYVTTSEDERAEILDILRDRDIRVDWVPATN